MRVKHCLAALAAATAAILVCSASVAVAPEFDAPVAIGSSVNSTGWEDSAQVTPDGQRLYFSYHRIDPILWRTSGVVRLGPTRLGWPSVSPFNEHGAELYVAAYAAGVWNQPQHLGTVINLPADCEGDVWISEDEQRILFTNGDGSPQRPSGIYYSSKVTGAWTAPVLASAMGFPFQPGDENPHLTRDEQTLFFESSRTSGYGRPDIWMSKKVNGTWQAPVNLGSRINTSGIEGSPFSLDGQTLYFDDKGSGGGIYRSVKQVDGTWSPRQIVIAGYAGDPSLTLGGDLYFVEGSALFDGLGQLIGYDSTVMVARKRLP